MVACPSCSAQRDPLWKYCVGCGTPVVGPARMAKVDPIALAVVGSVGAFPATSVSFR